MKSRLLAEEHPSVNQSNSLDHTLIALNPEIVNLVDSVYRACVCDARV